VKLIIKYPSEKIRNNALQQAIKRLMERGVATWTTICLNI